jgi:hypothetical protein
MTSNNDSVPRSGITRNLVGSRLAIVRAEPICVVID